jgi:hypothetical protein
VKRFDELEFVSFYQFNSRICYYGITLPIFELNSNSNIKMITYDEIYFAILIVLPEHFQVSPETVQIVEEELDFHEETITVRF